MVILITGICGFVGRALANNLRARLEGLEIIGLDNLSRPGSEVNRRWPKPSGIRFVHGDIRNPSDLEDLPRADWVIEAAANPSVLAGVNGQTSSRQLFEHNLVGTLNLLEYAKRHRSGVVMLSTSRVYSQALLADLPVEVRGDAFVPSLEGKSPAQVSASGVTELFPTSAPLSLYGAAKLASEIAVLEYGAAFDLPVFVNRCGVLAGAGQFGKADQGIFSFWIHSWISQRPLKYIGFGGNGCQVRDCLHPNDLGGLIAAQTRRPEKSGSILNVSGGARNSMSLAQLSSWCAQRFGSREITSAPGNRKFDVPWLVLDSARAAAEWGWHPESRLEEILEEIAAHAVQHPEWLEISNSA